MKYKTKREAANGNYLYLKDFRQLYMHNVCERDVLMVDDSPQKNSTNNPYNALHPVPFDPLTMVYDRDEYLLNNLYPFLVDWADSEKATPQYVYDNMGRVFGRDPFPILKEYWMKDACDEDSRLIWRTTPLSARQEYVAHMNSLGREEEEESE